MRIGILGTGAVGTTIATKLISGGHEVKLGGRDAANAKASAWAAGAGPTASYGTFADAAAFGRVVFNCTRGDVSLAALDLAGGENLRSKVLVDVANPLDFSKGMPARLTVANDDSLGEQIQRRFPDARVVKALNTVTASIMVAPGMLHGEHDLFICGNDASAKADVTGLLREWGWQTIHDLGDISMSRGTEMYLPLWLRVFMKLGAPQFNIHVVR